MSLNKEILLIQCAVCANGQFHHVECGKCAIDRKLSTAKNNILLHDYKHSWLIGLPGVFQWMSQGTPLLPQSKQPRVVHLKYQTHILIRLIQFKAWELAQDEIWRKP
jgi:hypothetical protein